MQKIGLINQKWLVYPKVVVCTPWGKHGMVFVFKSPLTMVYIPQNCSLIFLNGENYDEPGGIRQLAFTPILGCKWLQVSALNLTGMYQGMYGVVSRFRTLKFTQSRAVSADFNQHFFL